MDNSKDLRRLGITLSVGLALFALTIFAQSASGACDPKSFDYVACEINRQIKPVGKEVNNLGTQVDHLADQVVPAMQTQLNNMTTAVQNVKTTFDTLQGGATDVVTEMNTALNSLSAETMTLSNEFVEILVGGHRTVVSQLDMQSAPYRTFVGGPGGCGPTCVQFRLEIARLIRNLERTANASNRALAAQLDVIGQEPMPYVLQVNLEQAAQLFETAPGALLFPLHEAFKALPGVMAESEFAAAGALCDQEYCANDPACQFLNAMNQMLCRVDGALQRILAGAAVSKRSELRTQEGVIPRSLLCATMFQTEGAADWIADVAVIASVTGTLLDAIGKFMEGLGLGIFDWGIEGGVDAGIAGEGAVKARTLRRFGKYIRAVGVPLKALADLVSTRVTDCRNRLNDKLVICTLVNNAKKNSTFETCRHEVLWTTTRQFGFD